MSLYFDAAAILTDATRGGSLKSRIYNPNPKTKHKTKAPPAQIYALIVESSKWDTVLKEVIDKAGVLAAEPKLTPLLSLLLTHDLLLSKKGVAAPATHPLRLAIERHKTRLKAEFTKVRVKRGCATVEQLKDQLQKAKRQNEGSFSPRWVRLNNAVSSLSRELKDTFADYEPVSSLSELSKAVMKSYYMDSHIPDLLALQPSVDLTSTEAYKSGRIILQDKASCLPAYLLLGDLSSGYWNGDIIDGCAAPGNKTTHLASLLSASSRTEKKGDGKYKILSFDASPMRSKVLQKMVDTAGLSKRVTVFPGTDFLSMDPNDPQFKNVTALLLDPSCSGSGIKNREDIPTLALPEAAPSKKRPARSDTSSGRRKKRKFDNDRNCSPDAAAPADATEEETRDLNIDIERLTKLSNVQTQIVLHAFKFPAATRVTYSTCSIHEEENENVVHRLLASPIAKQRGWRIMRRDEQVEGMKKWEYRGLKTSERNEGSNWSLSAEESDACIRCAADDEEGTGGFFVAGFVRDDALALEEAKDSDSRELTDDKDGDDDDEESWEGFSSG